MSITLEQMQKAIKNNAGRDIEDREIVIGMVRSGQPFPALLSSWLLGGQTQQGKSCIAAFFVMWFVMAGSQIVLLDPHLHNKKRGLYTKIAPLHEWFARPPIDCLDLEEILGMIDWLEAEYKDRKYSMTDKAPLLLVIDEFNELLSSGFTKKQGERVGTVIGNVARGGSKHGMFVLAIGHNFDLASAGGNAVRRNILGRVSVNAEVGEMSNILDTTDRTKIKQLATNPTPLRPGQAIVKVPGWGLYRLYYPMITPDYLEAFAIFLRKQTALTPGIPDSSPQTSGFLAEFQESGISTPSPIALLPVERPESFTPSPSVDTLNASSEPLNFQIQLLETLNQSHKNLKISEDEFKQIIIEGNTQLTETGRVVRGKIVEAMNGNSHTSRKVKAVCDYMGWGLSMNTDKISPEQRKELLEQARNRCSQCGATSDLTIDHIIPRAKGGSNEPTNLTVLCRKCNSSKGIKSA